VSRTVNDIASSKPVMANLKSHHCKCFETSLPNSTAYMQAKLIVKVPNGHSNEIPVGHSFLSHWHLGHCLPEGQKQRKVSDLSKQSIKLALSYVKPKTHKVCRITLAPESGQGGCVCVCVRDCSPGVEKVALIRFI
jgi:hypothetical protein